MFTARSSYAVTGSTLSELLVVLHTLGPTRNGRTYSAVTDWRIAWSFGVDMGGATSCISRIRVDVHTHVVLPRWRPPSSAPASLRGEWQRYLGIVEMHEQGHVNIAVEAGRRMLGALEGLAAFPEADALRREANAVVAYELAAARERERAYDTETENGVLQGARLTGTTKEEETIGYAVRG